MLLIICWKLQTFPADQLTNIVTTLNDHLYQAWTINQTANMDEGFIEITAAAILFFICPKQPFYVRRCGASEIPWTIICIF